MSTCNRLTCKYYSLRGNYRTFQCKARFLLGLTKGYHLFLTGPILRPLIKKDGDMHIEYHGTNLIHSLISNILLLFLLTTYLSRHQHTTLCGNNQTLKIYQGRCCADLIDPNVLCQRSDCFFLPWCTKKQNVFKTHTGCNLELSNACAYPFAACGVDKHDRLTSTQYSSVGVKSKYTLSLFLIWMSQKETNCQQSAPISQEMVFLYWFI